MNDAQWQGSGAVDAALTALNRRSFLKAGLMLGAGLSTGLTLGGCAQSESPLPEGIQHLLPKHLPLFQKLITVLLPEQEVGLTPANEVPILQNIDGMLGVMNAETRADVLTLFDLFEYSSVLMGEFTRFSLLDDDKAWQHIEDCQGADMFIPRAVVTAMKKFVYVSYWRDDSTWGPIEFDGAVSQQWKLPSLGNAPLPKGVAVQ